jgi:hypothetical protein
MVHENAAHHASGDGEEVRSVVPLDCLPVHQTHIRLVNKRRRLEAMTSGLSCHAASRDSVKFLMDERDQSLEGPLVASSPFEKQAGDFCRLFCNPAILCPYLDGHDWCR